MTTFVDSSVWFSAVFAKDARHALATKILSENSPLATSDHIVIVVIYRYGTARGRAFEVLR